MSIFSDCVGRMDTAILTTHADEVTYIQRAGGSYTLTGVLDSGTELQKSEGVYQSLWAPVGNFTLGEPVNGDVVVIDDVRYRVSGTPDRDAMGGRRIKLSVTI